jgi:hypothetical protein
MYAPILTGDVTLRSNGIAHCRGPCVISTSPFPPSPAVAFSFEFIFISGESPSISFGISSDSFEKSIDYFDILQSARESSVDPVIPFDAIAVPVRLLLQGDCLSLFVDNHCDSLPSPTGSSFTFFLRVSAAEAFVSTPFGAPVSAFFPGHEPRIWHDGGSSVGLRGPIARGGIDHPVVLYGERPLSQLPGVGFMYFEVELRITTGRSKASVAIGLCEDAREGSGSTLGSTSRSVALSSETNVLLVGGARRSAVEGSLKGGHIVGMGIRSEGALFVTHDGRDALVNVIEFLDFRRYLPCVRLGQEAECAINFGERPFAFAPATPPPGWSLADGGRPDEQLYRVGFLNVPHLLHVFVVSSRQPEYSDPRILRKECEADDKFEVSMLGVAEGDLVGCGYVDCEFSLRNMVGWIPRTIAVHTDDGSIFSEQGSGRPLIPGTMNLEEGDSLAMQWNNGRITAFRNGAPSELPGMWRCRPFPAFSTQASCLAVLNLGELPFFGTAPPPTDDDTVQLFNRCRIVPTNENLEESGLLPGDEIEARDLSFRGTFMGEFRGLFLVTLNGIHGAIPIDITEPLLIRKLLRVVHRPVPISRPILTIADTLAFCESAPDQNRITGMYATSNGIAILIGRSSAGYVMRPVIDLVNNESLFILPELPPCLADFSTEGRLLGTFRTPDTFCLDLIEDEKKKVYLMLGELNGAEFGWNGHVVSRVRPRRTLWFRFFGYGFRCAGRDPRCFNFGTRPAGKLFHANDFAREGDAPFPSLSVQSAHGADGLTPVPGIVLALLNGLNDACLAATGAAPFAIPQAPRLESHVLYGSDEGPEPPKEIEKPALVLRTRFC